MVPPAPGNTPMMNPSGEPRSQGMNDRLQVSFGIDTLPIVLASSLTTSLMVLKFLNTSVTA